MHNTIQNSSDNLPTYLQTNIIALMLSIGGQGCERGVGSPPVWSRGKARIGVWGKPPVDKLKVLAHVHIFCIYALSKIYLQVKEEHGSIGPMVNTLQLPWTIHSSVLPLHPCVLPSWKEGVRRSFAGKF